MSKHRMTKEEYITKESIFLSEVCQQHCMFCSVKKPEFCVFFFDNLGKNFITNVIFPIKIARERYPRLVDALKCVEGFSALFCNPELCKFHTEHCDNRQKVSCFQMFILQSGNALKEDKEESLLENWDVALERELCQELDNISRVTQSMPKKKRKRLFKIADRIMNMISGWRSSSPKPDSKVCTTTKASKVKVKKEVTTTIFYNDNEEWANRIKNILEGRSVENIDRQSDSIN